MVASVAVSALPSPPPPAKLRNSALNRRINSSLRSGKLKVCNSPRASSTDPRFQIRWKASRQYFQYPHHPFLA
eukprot:CAMPEP_0204372898 /NCGR_PEP_ID=MMETSP0469-20131031/47633_1 /ASSEMBLY_ACC=CAM_ASM_000384 /TAXON_ID=2969 /ORGANISM="Oxyrrhis marina" /LENGTH=72 /DNA_ID=CAMNT_0051363261 /DNA_START=55 /DNA_END=270 /DNA_ORIENTATION=+